MRHRKGTFISLLTLAIAGVAAVSCVDEKVVYRDSPRFDSTAARASAGYLGYAREADTQTVCANCHAGVGGDWKATKHATAWKDLQASGHATAACEGCHTVSALGNADTSSKGGFFAAKDARYHDVQCESCHGPGLTHVSAPNRTNQPLASIAVMSMTDTSSAKLMGCAECHNGTHHPFVEEWKLSAHGMGHEVSHTETNVSCQPCHTGQGALKAWGIIANYKEANFTGAAGTAVQITCAVCHDPHTKSEEGQVRFSLSATNEQDNLCMKCHHRRGTPDMASQNRGAHSPEAPLLLGYAGWWPPDMQVNGAPDTLTTTHGNPAANPRLCAGCHVYRFSATDSLTKAFAFQVTGHRFEATPCVNASGIPTRDQTRDANGNCVEGTETFRSCVASGCHSSEGAVKTLKTVAEGRLEDLAAEVRRLAALATAKVPADTNSKDTKYSVIEGAKFNASFVDKPGSFAHNPFLVEALLRGSINALKTTYGVASRPGLDLQPLLHKR